MVAVAFKEVIDNRYGTLNDVEIVKDYFNMWQDKYYALLEEDPTSELVEKAEYRLSVLEKRYAELIAD